jgi:hypothetical protein
MSYQNQVSFVGELNADPQNIRLIHLTDSGMATPSIEFEVITDLAAVGGRHRCIANGEDALRVVAFTLAVADQCLEVNFQGWLRSQPNNVVVVADDIRYLVSSTTREKAAITLNEIHQGKVRLDLPASGRKRS